jgi:DNA-binding NarL/FixJ family response regulator
VIRVYVAAASEVVRAGLVSLVSDHPEIVVVGSSAGAGFPVLEQGSADVILIDAGDASVDAQDGLPPAVWLIGGQEQIPPGARGALLRDASAREITAAIVAVAAGLTVQHPHFSESRSALPARLSEPLTNREIEVLRMLAEGLGNKEIAFRLGISEHTVKFHLSSIFAKLNASTRTEAVTIGARLGLILL